VCVKLFFVYLQIKTKVDLPVGKNLKDHLMFFQIFIVDKPISLIPERDLGIDTLVDYFFKKTGTLKPEPLYIGLYLHMQIILQLIVFWEGPFTIPTAAYAQLFTCSSISNCSKTVDWPDIQVFYVPLGLHQQIHNDFPRIFKFDKETFTKLVSPHMGKDAIFNPTAIVRPRSTGQITLKDSNPFSPPVIEPNYLDHPDDIKMAIEGRNV